MEAHYTFWIAEAVDLIGIKWIGTFKGLDVVRCCLSQFVVQLIRHRDCGFDTERIATSFIRDDVRNPLFLVALQNTSVGE